MNRVQNDGRRSAVLVDRENVVAQENLETALFGKFRNVLRAIVANGRIFSGKSCGKHFYSSRKTHLSCASFDEGQDR